MALSWNEIKQRATTFSKEWENESSEDAEAKSFWDGFFQIFGTNRRRIAAFEHHVKKLNNKDGYIDLFWPGVIVAEHKSRGKDLDRAYTQAIDYFPGLKDYELPRYILVSDFERFRLHHLETGERHDFLLKDLVHHVQLFDFMAGYERRSYKEQDPVNIEAAERMGRLHDQLKATGYEGHDLELYLVRLLFCLFADDTTIFEKGIFQDFIAQRTAEDGSDLAPRLAELFEVLNRPADKRLKNLDEQLAAFPYVNGKLFEERLPIAAFDSQMRQTLLHCCALDWGKISPAIFGSLFQSVMDEKARRNLGAHYTSEKNILKVIRPLFLDALWEEFEKAKGNTNRLRLFHKKIASLRFLDPACGCGNFLIIAYRELRLLEIELVKVLLKGQAVTSVNDYLLVEVDHFYGIEYDEFPAQIAQVAMWLMDHQMNMLAGEAFGQYYVRLPLKKSAAIHHGNALRTDWQGLLQRDLKDLWAGEKEAAPLRFDYIFGNPPFVGSRLMAPGQRADLATVFGQNEVSGVLDYVSGWYFLAAKYTNDSKQTKCAFVSTNSITQGEQVSVLWSLLINEFQTKINFAHQTFKWNNEARSNAAVYCVIVGFSKLDVPDKELFHYENISADPVKLSVQNINPYLVNGPTLLIEKRTQPISGTPKLIRGSIPYDDGHLLLSKSEAEEIVSKWPELKEYVRTYGGANELINDQWRYCLWLKDAELSIIRKNPFLKDRIEKVLSFRLASKGQSVKSKAKTPALFGDIRQPSGENYLLIPRHSSERRNYIPIGFIPQSVILADSAYGLPNATLFHFGILTSKMHMAWVKYVCGRLESRFRYSKDIVYNNFPWPENPSDKSIQSVAAAAQHVLDARAQYPGSSLADLYDPLSMPAPLAKAHAALDKAVDACYRPQPFPDEATRMEFLFAAYERLSSGLFAAAPKKPKKPKPASGSKQISLAYWHSGHDSKPAGHDSKPASHDSKHSGHDSKVAGHDSKVASHDSKGASHDPKVASHDSKPASESPETAAVAAMRLI